jgi:hypothetical protein
VVRPGIGLTVGIVVSALMLAWLARRAA